jgi:hypothetical protein
MKTTLFSLFILLVFLCDFNTAAGTEPSEYDSLEAAIRDLDQTYGADYPRAAKFLEEIDQLRDSSDKTALDSLRREALLANPLLTDQSILFIVRPQYRNEHGTEATMYQTGEINTHCFQGGSAIKLLDLSSGKTSTLLECPDGVIRDPEIHFDGERILFSMRRNIEDDYHLYEMNVSDTEPRQLTFGSRVSDIQPIYLANDDIVFSSTRDPKYIPCQRHLMANLFRMNSDGSNIYSADAPLNDNASTQVRTTMNGGVGINIRQLGYNTQFEGRASLMPDGRILYTRWEYVDKHFSSAYGLWTVNPDGTNHALYYGNYAWQPGAIVDARMIPDSDYFVSVFTSVHDLGWGAVTIVDRSRGLDGTEPVLHAWPGDIDPYLAQWDVEERIGNRYDSLMKLPIKYEDPYPLSEKQILCSRQLTSGGPLGLFLIDTFGNELLLHQEGPGCFDPMPLSPRTRPPMPPSRVDPTQDNGEFYVGNVYQGDGMERIAPGAAKYLRIVEAPSKRYWVPKGMGDWAAAGSGDSHHPVALNWNHYNNKKILGTAPVEEDGSAYFKVPAGRFVYFQLLDENGLMIHSMRSGTMLQRGERQGCTGCHESRMEATVANAATMALSRPPSELDGWYGPERNFNYATEVQPVLDRHCVSCHDYGGDAEEINLSGDKGILFSNSYINLMRSSPSYYVRSEHEDVEPKPLISSVGAGPVKILPPYSWGSHCSRLVDLLQEGHYDVELDGEEFDRLVTWIDLNTPYYPDHSSYYYRNTAGRSPLDHQQLQELGELVLQSSNGSQYGWNRVNEYQAQQLGGLMTKYGPIANFTRPENSLCLQGFEDVGDPGYSRALELIRLGGEALQEHPRCEMPGYIPCEAHQLQSEFLAEQLQRLSAVE